MSVVQANCPSCGALVNFKSGQSVVVICEYCRSAVARTDRALEDLGKVAEVVETGSPLALGTRGRWRDAAFELTGRAQIKHPLGGQWDEWYATFQNGWLGWLAEAQGRFYLTFEQPQDGAQRLPTFDELHVGQPVANLPQQPTPLTVAEKGTAQYLAAAGEIPYRLTPNESYAYADLSGAAGEFATLDYGDHAPHYFSGAQVTLDDLGIKSTRKTERAARQVAAGALGCPHCGGSLELRAPDQTERVTCPYCNSLLDVKQGNLKYLKTLEPFPFQPLIPIGAQGNLPEGSMTVIGVMQRSVTIEGETYHWSEYLCYEPRIGFRWLVHSDNHWSYVQPVAPGEVTATDFAGKGATAFYKGQTFKIFQDAVATAEHVLGEFYWRVEAGERARATDYIKPPLMLSREISGNQNNAEVNWSLGAYMPTADVEAAFNVKDLPQPSLVAPNQPFKGHGIGKYWALFTVALLVSALVLTILGGSKSDVSWQSYTFQPLANADATQVIFTEPLQLQERRNVRVTVSAPVDNSWFYTEGDLINDETGLVQSFPLSVEYYHGVEDGESWSEGKAEAATTLSALPAGNYTVRLEAQWEKWQQPMTVSVRVEQNVSDGVNLTIAFFLLLLIPLWVGIRKLMFESRRWSQSMYSASNSGDE